MRYIYIAKENNELHTKLLHDMVYGRNITAIINKHFQYEIRIIILLIILFILGKITTWIRIILQYSCHGFL
jgi:hypothetical protein